MSENIVSRVRKSQMGSVSTKSEIELRQTNEGVKEAWEELNNIKNQINKAKADAIKAIDFQYKELLLAKEKQYAVMLKLAK